MAADDRGGSCTVHQEEPTVTATPAQVLHGYPVGPKPDAAVCIGCGAPLRETDRVHARPG